VLQLHVPLEARCLDPVHRVRQVIEAEAVGGPLALLGLLVAHEDDMGGLEPLHGAHVLAADDAPVLEGLGHAVEVVSVLDSRAADVKDNDGVAVIDVRHVIHFSAEANSAALANEIRRETGLAVVAGRIVDPVDPTVSSFLFEPVEDLLLPGAGGKGGVVDRHILEGISQGANLAPEEEELAREFLCQLMV